jgi:hypothetical protein
LFGHVADRSCGGWGRLYIVWVGFYLTSFAVLCLWVSLRFEWRFLGLIYLLGSGFAGLNRRWKLDGGLVGRSF